MKLSKSKLALAKVINENGGWIGVADCATQDKDEWVCFYEGKPTRRGESWRDNGDCLYKYGFYGGDKIQNWHQCVLSREEYYQAYPKADDIKLEIRWVRGGEVCATPTSHDCMEMLIAKGDFLWCECAECNEFYNRKNLPTVTPADSSDVDGWIEWKGGDCPVDGRSLVDYKMRDGDTCEDGEEVSNLEWEHRLVSYDIIAYRLHKP